MAAFRVAAQTASPMSSGTLALNTGRPGGRAGLGGAGNSTGGPSSATWRGAGQASRSPSSRVNGPVFGTGSGPSMRTANTWSPRRISEPCSTTAAPSTMSPSTSSRPIEPVDRTVTRSATSIRARSGTPGDRGSGMSAPSHQPSAFVPCRSVCRRPSVAVSDTVDRSGGAGAVRSAGTSRTTEPDGGAPRCAARSGSSGRLPVTSRVRWFRRPSLRAACGMAFAAARAMSPIVAPGPRSRERSTPGPGSGSDAGGRTRYRSST